MKEFSIKKGNFIVERSDSLKSFFRDINIFKLLTPEEETILANCHHNQPNEPEGLDARNKLVMSNMLFVVSVAKSYQGYGFHLSDLISEGYIGALKAVEHFKPSHGIRFISYAVHWIRQSIQQFLEENGRIVRLPSNQLSLLQRVKIASDNFFQKHMREPRVDELADMLGVDEHLIKRVLCSENEKISLDLQPYDNNDAVTLSDIMADTSFATDSNLTHESNVIALNEIISDALTERNGEIVKYAYGICGHEPKTLTQLAEMYNISDERTRQIVNESIKTLKSHIQLSSLAREVA